MGSYRGGVLVVSAITLASGCVSSPAPVARAEAVGRAQCDQEAREQEVPIVRSAAVLNVEPLYSHVPTSNNNSEERVIGAKLLVRPPRGVSAEQMTRVLQCHGARLLLGRVDRNAIPNDPYWLPDAWLTIDVKPENGNFAVTLSADSVRENIQVLDRAKRYADEHALPTDPGPP